MTIFYRCLFKKTIKKLLVLVEVSIKASGISTLYKSLGFHAKVMTVVVEKPLLELPHNLTKALKQFLVYGLVVPLICA